VRATASGCFKRGATVYSYQLSDLKFQIPNLKFFGRAARSPPVAVLF
jgi:hypothetical protein